MQNYREDAPTYRFEGTEAIDKAFAYIAKANARLAKAGIEGHFQAINSTTGKFERKEGYFPFQTIELIDFVEFDLNVPSIGIDGWTFVASVSFEEGGTLVNTVPGKDLSDWTRPEAHLCEHCGTKRRRTKSYVLKNDETGEYIQIGSSCLVLFLGVQPALWAVEFELPDFVSSGSTYVAPRYDRDLWIAITLSVTERGAKFVSRSRAGEQNGPASSHEVMDVYSPNKILLRKDANYAAWVEKHREEALRIQAEEPELIQAVKDAGERVGIESDYGMNLAVALASETVSSRALGILTSVVSVYHRELVQEVEKQTAEPVASGFLGEVKERLRGLSVTVTDVRYIEGDYGTTSLIKFRTDDNHVAAWFASGFREFEIGSKLIIDGTVKKVEPYRGEDQTTLTRVTVKG